MDPQATFLRRFEDLVALLRADPGNDAAQDLALTAAGAAIIHGPVRLQSGIGRSAARGELTLQARLLARRVDSICIGPDVDLSELLGLARALAHDTLPLPASPHIEVVLVPTPDPRGPNRSEPPPSNSGSAAQTRRRGAERRTGQERRRTTKPLWPGLERRRGTDRRMTGERRLHLVKDVRAESVRLYDGLIRAAETGAWEEALYAARGLARLTPRVPQAQRRVFLIQVRRILRRSVIDALIDVAERDLLARPAAVEVLCWLDLEAAEAMLDRLQQAPILGPRGFLLDALGRMPQVYPMIVPFLRSSHAREIRYGAIIAGKLGRTEAAPLLRSHLDNPDEDVRTAAVHALGELHHAPVADALRAALHHTSAATRRAAAEAIATWRAGALGVVLGTALETERDRTVWATFVDVLGRIGSASACATLATVAVTRRSLLHPRGYAREQRLAAVAALARANTEAAHATLERLAHAEEAVIRTEATKALRPPGDASASASASA